MIESRDGANKVHGSCMHLLLVLYIDTNLSTLTAYKKQQQPTKLHSELIAKLVGFVRDGIAKNRSSFKTHQLFTSSRPRDFKRTLLKCCIPF